MIRVRIVGYVALAALVLYLFGRWEQRQGSEDQGIITLAHQALASGKAYRVRQDSLRTRAERAVVTVRVRDTVIVRLDARLATDTTPRDSIRTLLQKADTLRAQRDSLLSAVRLLTVRAERAELRVADLERNLHATLTVAECHILGVGFLPKCPSRTAAFLLGAGGASLAILVSRH